MENRSKRRLQKNVGTFKAHELRLRTAIHRNVAIKVLNE